MEVSEGFTLNFFWENKNATYCIFVIFIAFKIKLLQRTNLKTFPTFNSNSLVFPDFSNWANSKGFSGL